MVLKPATVLIFLIVLCAPGVWANDPVDPREIELERLNCAFRDEQSKPDHDRQKLDDLNRKMATLWLEIYRDKTVRLHDAWKAEADAQKKKELGDELVHAAINADQADLVIQVVTDDAYLQKEIKRPDQFEQVPLKTLRVFPFEERPLFYHEPAWVVRRMTRTRFELWTPRNGWLFDSDGQLVNEAHPPRRDGLGRQWYGAFLPDGRWVTTDLWEMDRMLSFFSKRGQWQKEISSTDLVPHKSDEGRGDLPALIGWCRCDRRGKGFLLSVGANGGWGTAWVNWAGQHRLLQDQKEPWQRCYPRDLEPKGMYTQLWIPADDASEICIRAEPGHGSGVGFPDYRSGKIDVVIPDGEAFGFWPESDNIYIVSGRWEAIDPAPNAEHKRDAEQKTWFYDAEGVFAGWIPAGRIADTPKGDAMLFRDASDRIIAVTKTYEVKSATEFLWSTGTTARPFKLFPDLKLGFFVRDKELVLAAW